MIDWRHWHNEPHLIGGLVLLAWLYALLTGPLRARVALGEPYPRRQAWRFYAALVIFYLAVGSPLDQMGERFLFSAHMVQHQIIVYPAAALFLLGLPGWLVRPLTGRRPGRLQRGLVHPLTCALVYSLTVSLWHAPDLYDWALQNRTVHIVEHIMFFATALLYWWPVLSPSAELPRLRPGAQMLYQIGVIIAMTPLFAYLAFFSEYPLYPTYEYAPRLVAQIAPMDDQLLAAAIMKIGGMFVAFIVFAYAFVQWHDEASDPQSPPT